MKRKASQRGEAGAPAPVGSAPAGISAPTPHGSALKGRKDSKTKRDSLTGSTSDSGLDALGAKYALLESGGVHPLSIGHNILVMYRDGSQRTAKIIERSIPTVPTGKLQYYVHYHDFNRRMDEWIDTSRILATEGVVVEDHHHGAHSKGKQAEGGDQPAKRLKQSQSDSTDSLSAAVHSSSIVEDDNSSSSLHDSKQGHAPEGKSGSGVTTIAELGYDEHEGLDEASLIEHEEITKIKNIANVVLGRHKLECWYYSPFPKEFHPHGPVDCLYFCEFTMRFFKTKNELIRYQSHLNLPRHPPGNEIYRDSKVAMFELDGAVEKIYCQNLCYFAKLFLDHKTLYWDVDPFLFYVLCTFDERGYHPVGFFSKEKYSDLGYNLACILTFPSAQRQGFGRFLIQFSYELSKKEEKVGSPEKPLSDLGAVSYKSYWASSVLVVLKAFPGKSISINDLTRMTSILGDDIIATLIMLDLLRYNEEQQQHVLCCTPSAIDALLEKYPQQPLVVDPTLLNWAPLYVVDWKKDKWSVKGLKDD